MNIFVIGSTGRVAQELIKALVKDGHQVFAGARQPEKVVESEQVTPVKFDLHWDVPEMDQALKNAEAVYYVAGSRGKDLLQTDLFGAKKAMEATEKAGIGRYIQLSSANSMQPETWKGSGLEALMDYNIAKLFADHWLIDHTDLEYTILQPGSLEEAPATGKVALNSGELGKNTIPDVAKVLAGLLTNEAAKKQVVAMLNGDEEISAALNSL